MTRWLDDDEQRTWRSFLATSELLYGALDRQLQRDAGINHASYVVLAMLSEAPGRSLRMSELAALANSSPSRLSHAVARLQERGWIRREPTPKDGRGTVAVLTDAGWDKVTATAPGHVAEVRRLVLDPLTRTQLRQLHEIATRIRQVLRPDGTLPTLDPLDAS